MINLRHVDIRPTNILPESRASNADKLNVHTKVLCMDKETAAKVLQDIINDLAGTGISKLILRDDDDCFYILSVK